MTPRMKVPLKGQGRQAPLAMLRQGRTQPAPLWLHQGQILVQGRQVPHWSDQLRVDEEVRYEKWSFIGLNLIEGLLNTIQKDVI